MRIHLWGVTDLPFLNRRLPVYIAGVLRSLGYRTKVHLVPYNSLDTPAKRRRLQLTVDGDWIPDYPTSVVLSAAVLQLRWRQQQEAVRLRPGPRPANAAGVGARAPGPGQRAVSLWAEIDHELVDRAYWVPTINAGVAELVSSRLRNYQYHPVWGFMAAQVWVR